MFFLFFLAQMYNFVYLCRRNKNNLKVLALFISYYNMDERTIKIVNEARWTDGQIVRNRLDDISYDPMGCQEDLIMRIARENAKTVFGCEHGFDKIDSISDFRMQVPVSVYDDYPKYIERIANGERNVLTAYLTEHLSIHEGYKKLPQSRWGVQAFYDYNFCAAFHIAGNEGYLTGGMTLNLVDNHIEQLPSGVYVGNLLGRQLIKREFDNDQVYAIPIDVIKSAGQNDIIYIRALCALAEKNVSLAICDRYSEMIDLLRYIEKHWPRLANEIEQGNSYVKHDAERADEIRQIMEEHHIGTQLVTKLWPDLRCMLVYDVCCLTTSFELLRTYCGRSVHFIFAGINSAIGSFSMPLNIDDPQTVLIPDCVFYEFRPVESKDYRELLTLDQVEMGKSYELVATTLSGLYRYRTNKIFYIVGHHHETPTVIIDK